MLKRFFLSLLKLRYGVSLLLAGCMAVCQGITLPSQADNLQIQLKSMYKFECFDKDGNLKWVEEVPNIVVTTGLNALLTDTFKASSYTAAWYVGLVDNASFSAYAAGDTMASHSGWLECAGYSNANRPTLTLGSVASGSTDNSASKAVFNINATKTVRGAFVCDNSTVSGTTGTLYGEADFAASRSVVTGDTLNVTVTLTAS